MNEVEAMARNCPVCGRENTEPPSIVGRLENPRNVGLKTYDLLRCSRCELIFLSPLPSQEAFDDLYKKNTQFLDSVDYTGEHAKSALQFYVDRVRALQFNLKLHGQPLRLLEIGSGLSWLSHAAKIISKDALTVAQDVTPEALEVCTWVDQYFVGEIENQLSKIEKLGPYHLISMTHVFEHLPYPIDTLLILESLLEKQGIIFITAPYRPKDWNKSSSIENWKSWSYNHVPGHLQYFNKKNLALCAGKVGLSLMYYDQTGDGGQALEAWLAKK